MLTLLIAISIAVHDAELNALCQMAHVRQNLDSRVVEICCITSVSPSGWCTCKGCTISHSPCALHHKSTANYHRLSLLPTFVSEMKSLPANSLIDDNTLPCDYWLSSACKAISPKWFYIFAGQQPWVHLTAHSTWFESVGIITKDTWKAYSCELALTNKSAVDNHFLI